MDRHLIIDDKACAGHGLCYGAVPEILDCDDEGYPLLVADPISDDLINAARHVVAICPERALGLSSTE